MIVGFFGFRFMFENPELSGNAFILKAGSVWYFTKFFAVESIWVNPIRQQLLIRANNINFFTYKFL